MPRTGLDLADRLEPMQTLLRRRLRQGRVLARVIRAVNSSFDPDRVSEEIAAQIGEWLPTVDWLVVAACEDGGCRPVGARGLTPATEAVSQAVGKQAIRARTMWGSADLSTDGRLAGTEGLLAVAALAIPLECRGRTIGAVVGLGGGPASRAPQFSPATLDALLAALEPGAIALDNALRVQRAEALSVTDDLTQLYNARYLALVLRREAKRAARCGRPLSLLFVDLDGFKAVNDTHGHMAGSRALVEAAGVIKRCARETDAVARFGGDEFCVVLPETGSDGALAVADRVRRQIAVHRFLEDEGLAISLTSSVGVATFPEVAGSSDALIHAADEAMYWIKGRGKNGIHVAG